MWLMTILDNTGLDSIGILHSDAGSSHMLALRVACAHLALLLEKNYFLRNFFFLCLGCLEYITIGRTKFLLNFDPFRLQVMRS